jgi:hypothetical protein
MLSLVSAVMFFTFIAGAASADETYKFSSGLSFSYPSGYQSQETIQTPITTVTLANASDPTMSFVISLAEGIATDAVIDDNLDEAAYKASLPQGVELVNYKKISVNEKPAVLTEFTTEQQGVFIFSRAIMIISGKDIISVGSAYMAKDKIDAGRKISEGIENSLKF